MIRRTSFLCVFSWADARKHTLSRECQNWGISSAGEDKDNILSWWGQYSILYTDTALAFNYISYHIKSVQIGVTYICLSLISEKYWAGADTIDNHPHLHPAGIEPPEKVRISFTTTITTIFITSTWWGWWWVLHPCSSAPPPASPCHPGWTGWSPGIYVFSITSDVGQRLSHWLWEQTLLLYFL